MSAVTYDTWQHGQYGEELFAVALHKALKAGKLPRGTVWFRNILFNEGPGDIDFLVAGPTGIFVFDVKHWSDSSHMWTSAERGAEVSKLEAEWISYRLQDALERLGTELVMGWVMTNARKTEYVSEIPCYTPNEAIDVMADHDAGISDLHLAALGRCIHNRFTLVSGPTAR